MLPCLVAILCPFHRNNVEPHKYKVVEHRMSTLTAAPEFQDASVRAKLHCRDLPPDRHCLTPQQLCVAECMAAPEPNALLLRCTVCTIALLNRPACVLRPGSKEPLVVKVFLKTLHCGSLRTCSSVTALRGAHKIDQVNVKALRGRASHQWARSTSTAQGAMAGERCPNPCGENF